MTSYRFATRALGAAAVASAVLFTAGCGGDSEPSAGHSQHGGESRADTFNDADVAFAQGMIPHHEQALAMAGLARDRADAEAVRELAEEIERAQGPEIATLRSWLSEWGAEEGHHGGHEMAGMLSGEEMAELEEASGAEFDAAFLRLMIVHHEGAVEMAGELERSGSYEPAKEMAREIASSQSSEIEQMTELLN
ncbi:DUF305 domain-containing protein [Streptomyces carpaticus]|uniref:DUF305 domain-containing protein n=1 Tax=Streptomyces TaxID=1883 RepID=UPI002207245E|nr:DUF305 domain-containing protein [Streptomyces carpaticus]